MICNRCGDNNVIVSSEQIIGNTKTKHKGCLFSIGRLILIISTFGLWLLVGKAKETGQTKFKHQTVAICQYCGYKWTV